MVHLAALLSSGGARVVITTTTKIWPPSYPVVLVENRSGWKEHLAELLQTETCVCLANSEAPDGKLKGVEPRLLCDLISSHQADVVVCEADGAAGRPLKVHGPNEPVIPPCSTLTLVLAGLDAVGQKVSAGAVHRIERAEEILQTKLTSVIEPSHVAQAMMAAVERIPTRSRVGFLLNKADNHERLGHARAIAHMLIQRGAHGAIIATRYDLERKLVGIHNLTHT